MSGKFLLRLARPDDLAAVDALLARSYPRLLRPDYPPSIMVTLVPLLARARPELLASGRYFLAEDAEGRILGAGGFSLSGWGGRDGAADRPIAEIRHVATDPDATRQGIGRRLMHAIFGAAEAEGVARYHCLSTLTAVPFYASVGFVVQGPIHVPLAPGLAFPAVRMQRGA
ncbi:GNAT family N-acetyltransferase [bacterium]|nr:GNAT family N-acetyltransferase [bacterium]